MTSNATTTPAPPLALQAPPVPSAASVKVRRICRGIYEVRPLDTSPTSGRRVLIGVEPHASRGARWTASSGCCRREVTGLATMRAAYAVALELLALPRCHAERSALLLAFVHGLGRELDRLGVEFPLEVIGAAAYLVGDDHAGEDLAGVLDAHRSLRDPRRALAAFTGAVARLSRATFATEAPRTARTVGAAAGGIR